MFYINQINENIKIFDQSIDCHDEDDLSPKYINTGLLDVKGNEILKVEYKNPIGFVIFGE